MTIRSQPMMKITESYPDIITSDYTSLCHCEPFAFCHSERSEESHDAQDRLREAILWLFLGLLRPPINRAPRNDIQV